MLVSASSAMAAEITEVRIGRHAEFTRVVFELDRAAGYRIERADPASDVAELVVSLDASSIPRRIQSSKSLIEQVDVEPAGSRSIVHIKLAKDGLRLKEMILASPPRIVLDVLEDPATLAAAKAARKPSPKATTSPKPVAKVAEKKTAAPAREEKSFDDVVAQIPTESKKLAMKPVEKTPVPAPPKATPKPVEKPVEKVAEKSKPVDEPKPEMAKPVAPAPLVAKAEPVVADEPSTSTPIDEAKSEATEKSLAMPKLIPPTPEPSASEVAEAKPAPRPMMVRTKPQTQEGPDYMFWGLVGGGALVVLLGGVMLVRRMRGGGEVDFSEEGAGEAGGDGEENPFGNLRGDDEQLTLGTAGRSKGSSLIDEEKESESVVFGDSEENKMEDMEVISRDQVNQSLGSEMPPMGGVPEEFQQMMREMNRRVEALEGRIDELVDARDRLERQVAAQTEELRVQRAAIARTQRAVRNLARPEDEEPEATEPALRDPNKPTS
jgi:hypothetical protein